MEKDTLLITFPVARIKQKLKIASAEKNICMNTFILLSIYKTNPELFKCASSSEVIDTIELKIHDNGNMEFIY